MWLGGIFFRVYLDFLPCLRRSVESLSWNSPMVGKGNFNYTWGWPWSLLQGLSRILFAWLYPNWNCHTLAEINFEHTYWRTHAHMHTCTHAHMCSTWQSPKSTQSKFKSRRLLLHMESIMSSLLHFAKEVSRIGLFI